MKLMQIVQHNFQQIVKMTNIFWKRLSQIKIRISLKNN